jgi:tetratricopeptide (TPR) repeat protein
MPEPRHLSMSKKRNDQQDRLLEALVARYEEGIANKFDLFLSEEEFEELLIHYFNEHDYDRTLEVADVAISQHSFTPEFYKWKALIHKINLEQEDALGALEKLSIYAPNDEEALMLRLEVLTHFEDRAGARDVLSHLNHLVEASDKRSLLAFFDGLLLLQEGEITESWEAFSEAVRLDPYQEPALDEMLNASEFGTKRSHLGGLLEELLDQDPFNDLLWYYLGLWYDDGQRDMDALDAFANARSLNYQNPNYDLEYADKLFDLDRYEEALKVYQAYFASEEAEDSYETYMRMGRSHQVLGQLKQARQAFYRAIELEPSMYDIYQHLAECFVAEEKWGMAAYNYGRAVEQHGHTADCWLGLALCNAAINEPEEAEPAFLKALELDDRFSDAIVSYALFLIDQGREIDALDLLRESLERYNDASLLFGAVAIHLLCNKRRIALEFLNEALANYYKDHDLLLEWYPALRDDEEVQALLSLHRPR